MAREMTPQERAADVIETWKTYDPTGFRIGHLTQLIEDAIKQTRRAALLEARQTVSQLFDQQVSELPDYYAALLDVGNALDRLAQEG